MLVTPTGRLELERAALNKFCASLNDDQKARFDAEIRRPRP